VTLYTVDQYYNWPPSDYTGPIDLMNDAGTVNGVPNTFEVNPTNGRANFTVVFTVVSASNYYTLYTTKPRSLSKQVYVYKTGQAYLHINAPPITTAGAYFPLTVTASASSTDPTQVVGSLTSSNTFRFQVFQSGTGLPATGTWEPTDPKGLAGGRYTGLGRYTRAELVFIRCQQETSGVTLYPVDRQMEVLPNLPAKVQVTVSPGRVQSQHTARITAQLYDAYDNPTNSVLYPDVRVIFEQVAGNGYLSTTQVATDAYGSAVCDYTAGIVNETATVRARVWNSNVGFEYTSNTATVQVSVAQAEPGAILNFPNPFNPAQNQTTAINYYLDYASDVQLRIYDPFGRLVLSKDLKADATDSVSRNATAAGGNTYVWDGKNGEGRVVANGIYLVKLKAQGGGATQEFTRRVGVRK
jgi:hypothetical protein